MPREHLQPRQSLPTSGVAATLTSTINVLTSIHTSALQTSDLTSTISSTSHLVSLTTSSATSSSSTNVHTTTTSSSLETTSTPRTTSLTTSTTPSISSETPSTSSSTSSSSHIASSVPPSSSPSSITQPPAPSSSSQQGTPTTITSAFTTYVNGSAIITQTAIPSTIPQLSGASSEKRTDIIAGSAAGGTALLVFFLSLAFCTRRKQFKRLDFLRAITLKRNRERSRAAFLDGEELDDVGIARVPRGYDYETSWDGTSCPLVGSGPDTRWPETAIGTVVRDGLSPSAVHEGTRLMDPVANRDDLDLSRIVDDVMGPSSSAAHFSDRSVSSMYRGSMAETEGLVHSRTVSNASNMALLDAAGLGAPGTVLTGPVRSSPLAQSRTERGPGSVEHQSGDVS